MKTCTGENVVFTLDLNSGRLFTDEGDVPLKPKVFKLLELMVNQPDSLITSKSILENLWPDTYVTKALVREYIHDLRRALNDNPKSPNYLQTVHGRGYRYIGSIKIIPRDKLTIDKIDSEVRQSEALLLNRLSIAVLPFTNMSGNPEQDYFADGLTVDIITNLSKFSELFVIARHSTFTYKNKTVSIKQVGQELGVRYVLGGSIEWALNAVRITVQLIDASTDQHLWSERYDRSLDDIFVIRDEVTQTIAATLMGIDGRIMKEETSRALLIKPTTLDAYDYTLRAIHLLQGDYTLADVQTAIEMLNHALTLDPLNLLANEFLAWSYIRKLYHNWAIERDQVLEWAFVWAKKTKAIDDKSYGAHQVLGNVYLYKREFEKSEAAYHRAHELNPNSSDVIVDMSIALVYVGRTEQAILGIKRAMRLNPFYPQWYARELGWAYAEAGEYENAIQVLNKVERSDDPWAELVLADCYASLDKIEESNVEVQRILTVEPKFSVSAYEEELKTTEPYKRLEQLDRHLGALRKTELPD